jgi:Transglycosylase SLT domain
MWRPDPSGPQGPMQVSKAAASDVGSGDRFDLTQNRLIGRAYLALLYGRYKNWPDAIAAYNWGLSNVDSWIRAGRPSEALLAGVAAYTNRILRDSGLCHGIKTKQLRLSAIFGDDREIRSVADPSSRARFAEFTPDGAQLTEDHKYLCQIEPSGRSKVSQKRRHGDRPVSLFERITVSARSSWKAAIHNLRFNGLT